MGAAVYKTNIIFAAVIQSKEPKWDQSILFNVSTTTFHSRSESWGATIISGQSGQVKQQGSGDGGVDGVGNLAHFMHKRPLFHYQQGLKPEQGAEPPPLPSL